VFRGLNCKRLQVDEVWSFVYAKQKNVPAAKSPPPGAGDIWTWTAIDADTKLVPSWYVGARDAEAAGLFIGDLASRLAGRVQLTSDGHKPYIQAVEDAFGADIGYAMLIKLYGQMPEAEKRYSPAECVGSIRHTVTGKPDRQHVSTSYAERQNLSMRMGMRRFTRLTNAFSKKVENHAHAMSIYFMHYNFVRIHQTLRVTPAMAAGVTSRLWELADMVQALEDWETRQDA
jgi:IS1 family transposase